ncbi:MAG TPA: FAD-dependent oxidoreductase [Bryobacteraceae bacterium]|jgi:monoamine oxidase|nr:FAD-dependent oxidoreductase [Bryobacteraceae bacterium]
MTPSQSSRPALTRRRFLGHLGAVGGSSLVMTALSSWDLMAADAGKRPVLSGRPRNAKVLVIGAGPSGLTVGYELSRLGYDFHMLEARDRVGGLAWAVKGGATHTEIGGETQKCNWDESLYVNVGPWRIPYSHTGVLGYCREWGVAMEMFVNESDASYFYYEGAAAGSLAKKKIRLREVKADIIGHVNELLVKAIDQKALDLPMTADDQQRLVRFLVSQGYLDSSDRSYKAFTNRGPGDPYQLTALLQVPGFTRNMRSVPQIEGTAAAPMFQPIGGMDMIWKAGARAIGPNRITLNAAVQSIRQDDRGATVVYKDTKTGHTQTHTADYVVICVPMTVLANMDVQISPETMAAVKATNHSNSGKMGLAMKRRFWEEDDQIFGGHLYSDLPLGEFSYPSNGYFSKKGVLLGLYSNGQYGELLDKSVAERIEHVLMNSSKVHPQIRQEFESAYAVWWKKVEYSRGGYASRPTAERLARLAKFDGRLLPGSAATTPYSQPDWQEGAVGAGWQALNTLHERAMRGTA